MKKTSFIVLPTILKKHKQKKTPHNSHNPDNPTSQNINIKPTKKQKNIQSSPLMTSTSKVSSASHTSKTILIGNSSVGKSSILLRFCCDDYKPGLTSTIGIDFRNKVVQVSGRSLRLQLWDTAGQERFKNVNQTYFKGAGAVVLVFSLVDRLSFQGVEGWVQQISQYVDQDVVRVLVGAKCDLEFERKVSTVQGKETANKFGMQYIEVSAKDNINISQLFDKISQKVMANILKKQQNKSKSQDSKKPNDKRISLDRREDQISKERCKC